MTGGVEGSARRARAVFAGGHTHRVPTDGQDRFDAAAVPIEFAAEGIGIAYVRDAGIAGGVEGSALLAEAMRANLSVGGTASPKQNDGPTQGGPCELPASLCSQRIESAAEDEIDDRSARKLPAHSLPSSLKSSYGLKRYERRGSGRSLIARLPQKARSLRADPSIA